MAELIGLIASIGTIASAAFTVAKSISDLADELGSAGRYVKAISTDTKAVALILHEMKRRLDRSTKITQHIFEVANEIADLCKADLDDIKLVLLQLLPAGGGNMRDFTKDEIKNLVTESKNTKSDFLVAERTDQALAQVYTKALLSDPATHTNNDDVDTIDVTVQLLDYGDKSQEEGTLALKDNDEQSSETMNLLRTAKTSQLGDQLSEFPVIESLSDDHYLYIARHIHTQKTVTSFALIVLGGRREQGLLSRNHPSEAKTGPNELQELSIYQGIDPRLSERFPAYNGEGRLSAADERSSRWDESESSRSSIDAERISGASAGGRGTMLVDEVNHYSRGMSHDRQSGDRRPKRAGVNTQETSESHVSPESPDHSRSQSNSPTFSEAPRHQGNRVPQMPYGNWNYTIPPPGQPHGHETNNASFGLPQQQPPWQQYPNAPYPSATEALKDDPEKEAMKLQLAEIKREQQRREEEARHKELESRIREEAEETFMRKMEQMRREEEIRAEERRKALERASKEIEDAKNEAHKAARQAIEVEMEVEAERKRKEEEKIAQTEQILRARLEAELRAEEGERRKGLGRLFFSLR
ncbi:hypothetical protein GQX73_g6174 [Xylaria multiplex]|uniref:Fungal N-terminal domain-containing protein n=1 Tax=Xylaria multiplex TaxID=323545 RepID=A0A7C8IQ64_9PEZI|nr:hypothetical protein GQX73_g6174 [Xylaria multiplex]